MGQFFSHSAKKFLDASDTPEIHTALNALLSLTAKSFMASTDSRCTDGFQFEKSLRPFSDVMGQIAAFIDIHNPEANPDVPADWREQQHVYLSLVTDGFYDLSNKMLTSEDEALVFNTPWSVILRSSASMALPYQRALERKIRHMYAGSESYAQQLTEHLPDGYLTPQALFNPRELITHMAGCAGMLALEAARVSYLARQPERRQLICDAVDILKPIAELDLLNAGPEKIYRLSEETHAAKLAQAREAFRDAYEIFVNTGAHELAYACEQIENIFSAVIGTGARRSAFESHFDRSAQSTTPTLRGDGNVLPVNFARGVPASRRQTSRDPQ